MQYNDGDLVDASYDHQTRHLESSSRSNFLQIEQNKVKYKAIVGLQTRPRVLLEHRHDTLTQLNLDALYTTNPIEIPQRFPPEIIIRILRLALLEEPRPLRQLVRFSQVCETWRRIVNENSSIWVRLDTNEILPSLTDNLQYFKQISETNTFSSCRDLILGSDTLFLKTFRETSLKINPKCLSYIVQINPIFESILLKALPNSRKLYLTNSSEIVRRHAEIIESNCTNVTAIELGADDIEPGAIFNNLTPNIITEQLLKSASATLREFYIHYPYQVSTLLSRLAKHCKQLTHLELGILEQGDETIKQNEDDSDSDGSSSSDDEDQTQCIDAKFISANFLHLKVFSCYSFEFTRHTAAPAVLTEMIDLRELRLPILKGCDQTRDEWTLRTLAQSSTRLIHLDARGCFLKVFSLGWLTTNKLRSLHLHYSVPSSAILKRWSSSLVYLTLSKVSEKYREHRSQGPPNPAPELDACLETLACAETSKLKYLDLSESDCGYLPVRYVFFDYRQTLTQNRHFLK